MAHFLPILGVFCYAFSTLFYVRELFDSNTEMQSAARSSSTARVFLLLGLVANLAFLLLYFGGYFDASVLSVSESGPGEFNYPVTLSIVGCGIASSLLVIERKLRSNVLGVFFVPVILTLSLYSGLLFHLPRPATGESASGSVESVLASVGNLTSGDFNLALALHLTAVVSASILFVLSFSVSLSLLILEWRVRTKRTVSRRFPPLLVLDRLNTRMIILGFGLMLVGISSGLVLGSAQGVRSWLADPRFLYSLITILTYGFLLFFRRNMSSGWMGRRSAWCAVLGFGTLVVSSLMVNIFGSSMHAF